MPNYRFFHPLIAEAYCEVHDWLQREPEAKGYKQVRYSRIPEQMTKLLTDKTLKMAAAQYNIFFPTHYFKVIHTLDTIITPAKVITWLQYNPYICLVDIGCGGGAASVALVETILRLHEQELLANKVTLYCLGIDVNLGALQIYNKLMAFLKQKLPPNIQLEHQICQQGIRQASDRVRDPLIKKREDWKLPCLSHVLMIQSNVIDMLSQEHYQRQQEYNELLALGIPAEAIVGDEKQFSSDYAKVYKQLLEDINIDKIHLITIGTNSDWKRIKEMSDAIDKIFGSSNHHIERLGQGTHKVDYENPIGSYWHPTQPTYYSEFHVDVSTVTSVKLEDDKDWKQVISLENLELAWVKARNYVLKEPLSDEVEIRLFEMNLTENLSRLQQQLIVYLKDVSQKEDYLSYAMFKESGVARPKGLSRLEGEILATAIIQKLGKKRAFSQGNSYAYRLASGQGDTEYCYENWFVAYGRFTDEARTLARQYEKQYEKVVIIRVDIESFYMKIVQQSLIDLTEELTESERVRWLLKLLLSKNLSDHNDGKGISQGSIGSGFFANLYLNAVDNVFGSQPTDNVWEVTLIRYVDDMILFIPDPRHVQDVLKALTDELEKLGLNLNDNKTERYDKASDFIEILKQDARLDQLQQEYYCVVNPLWITDVNIRQVFVSACRQDNDELWWNLVQNYQKFLEASSIYIEATDLSRRLYKYIFDAQRRKKDLQNSQQLTFYFPPYKEGTTRKLGLISFRRLNNEWFQKRRVLEINLLRLFRQSWIDLKNILKSNHNSRQEKVRKRQLKSNIRFISNKLSLLGFISPSKTLEPIEIIKEILCEAPWVFREPLQILESLARQGFLTVVPEVLAYYQNNPSQLSEYIRAVSLRSIRFLPRINYNVWEIVVSYATNGVLVERLMATETWLFLDYANLCDEFVEEQHINAVKKALKDEDAHNPRLKKNYLLILGLYNRREDIIEEPLNSLDYLLREARSIALEGSIKNLFAYAEPKIIRNKYYHKGRTFNDNGEAQGSP